MNPLIRIKTTPPLLITLALLCFGLLPRVQAVVPPPDGGYPGFNTAEGQNALFSLTTGAGNTALGWFSLFSDTAGSFNTATGAGALLFNTADNNTATGAAALLSNTSGGNNTAVGATALLNNTDGSGNTAIGFDALFRNTTGAGNTALGLFALAGNTEGNFNTALGDSAGSNITSANNVICIGINGQNVSDSCFIGNISGVEVTGVPVVVAANGQLGVAPTGSPLSANELLKQQRVVQDLKATTERQAAVIALQEGQIKALTASLKQQAETIIAKFEATDRQQQKQLETVTSTLQKVSAQLAASKPALQVVKNR